MLVKCHLDAEMISPEVLMIFGADWWVILNLRTGLCGRFTYEDIGL